MTVTPRPKNPKNKSARPTAAERAHALRMQQKAREEEINRQNAEFELVRTASWNEIWAQALRLFLLMRMNREFVNSRSWFFDEFRVYAKAQSFYMERQLSRDFTHLTESTLTREDYLDAKSSLESIYKDLKEFEEKAERERQAEIVRIARRKQLLAKAKETFTEEELKLLGFPKN